MKCNTTHSDHAEDSMVLTHLVRDPTAIGIPPYQLHPITLLQCFNPDLVPFYEDLIVFHHHTPPDIPYGRVIESPVEMQGGLICDHMVRLRELSPALFERSLEHEQERVVVTFGAIWRPVLAQESWASQTDAQRITEERCARLDLAEIVDSMRRGQEPRGDV
ncbi:hypothetical protein Tco_0941535 [Tanacetum coccineum]|uniref:Uncharacterized protein n=1 Tax=Tanacetum coccineum TaxID=301880 RepID=A0ABQ5DR49_9ASTR